MNLGIGFWFLVAATAFYVASTIEDLAKPWMTGIAGACFAAAFWVGRVFN